ncbi:heterokaryon incompatibility protein-domain-containing protein [Rhypophila decipiens]|uniref:Heterokaryon incompatibility protein-domain-containing protein n=1 Tax=Rhypophila decipiens TaxID=261697 RepID=A0AAN6XVR5_9PEZI|nr:heterokaryon incompatibility protein-domain-containing protein [Rhypophila decipiens]
MSEYQYKPLSANHIRLIELRPDLDGNAPVRCQLLEYPIHIREIGSHTYDALSYVWGPPPNTCHIEVVEGSECSVLSIRENCHAALVRLRDPILPRFVWVDSICINQEDNKEKTQQFRMMTGIYALAGRVVVWLREPPHEVGSIMDNGRGLEFIRRAAEHCAWSTTITDHDINLKLEPQDAKDITIVLKRSWFRRIWVSVIISVLISMGPLSCPVVYQHVVGVARSCCGSRGCHDGRPS